MAAPKPKTDEVLDEEDFVDLERTKINLRQRMEKRRALNQLYKDVLEMKQEGKLLSVKPALEAGKDV